MKKTISSRSTFESGDSGSKFIRTTSWSLRQSTARILYCGDSEASGPARYLLGILKQIKIQTLHIPPSMKLSSSCLKSIDLIIISDYAHSRVSLDVERQMERMVLDGMGLLMIGGWSSFTGRGGGWGGSLIEGLLPVKCLARDDRYQNSSGLWIFQKKPHAIFRNISFDPPPVICGLNQVQVKRDSEVLLTARDIVSCSNTPCLGTREWPLLVSHSSLRSLALMTDLAPHWCGGWIDWGTRRVKIRIKEGIEIEVGNRYVQFVSGLLKWFECHKSGALHE